ncbi:MAG: WD40/YVTN/BNR-like repeat-containing protein, partial [Gloeotrichia echinulata HAB0833]
PGDLVGVSFPTTATIQRFVAHNSTFFALTVAGAYQTNNGGQNWREVTINGQQLQALNSYNKLLYARVDSSNYFVSSDNATTWSPSTIKMAEHFVVSSTAIFKIANVGVQRSTDGGISWEIVPIGGVNDIIVFQEKVYTTSFGSCFVSSDNGNSWQTVSVRRHPFGTLVSLTSISNITNSILVASSFNRGPIVGTYCSSPRSPGLYRLRNDAWEFESYQTQLDKVYSFGTILLGLSKAECNDGWTNGGLFTSRNGTDWQPIVQRAIGTYKEWCSSCFDPYAAGFDNNGLVYIAARQISYSGPPTFRTER